MLFARALPLALVTLRHLPTITPRMDLCDDSCFAFYNPIQQRELEHYVNSWLENLVAASEYVVAHPRPHRKLR